MAWMPPESDQVVQNTPAPATSAWQPPETDQVVPTGNQSEKSLSGLAHNAMTDAGNIVSSTANLAGNMVAHPIDTTKQVVQGLPAGLKAWAQELGIPEAMHGKFMDALKTFGNSAYEKPVSRALDVASVAMPALKASGVLKGVDAAAMADKAAEVGNAASKAADARWTRAVGGTINNATELTRELGPIKGPEEFGRLGRLARNEGIVTPLNGVDSQAQKIAEMNAAAGKDVGDLRAAADLHGEAPKVGDLMNRIRGDVGPKYTPDISTETGDFDRALNKVQKLQPMDTLEPSEELAGHMEKPGATYEDFRRMQEDPNYVPEIDVQKPTTHSEIAKVATELNADAATKAKLLQASGATTDVANALARLNDESIMKALTPEQGAAYQKALQRFSDSKKLETMIGQKAGYEAGASRNRISNNLINRFQQRFGYQLTAEGLDRIAAVLKTNPEKFGKYASVLNAAMVGGPAALATTVHLLSQNDPNFAAQLGGVSNGK